MNASERMLISIDGEVERLVKEIEIPPCPEILTRIVREMQMEEPNITQVADWVAADVGLAAAMLKTVNSPFYGLRNKATSVKQALILLGLRNVAQLVTGLLLRQAFSVGQSATLDNFWKSSTSEAIACAIIAGELKGCDTNVAYTFGLFRDAGMPAMLAKKKGSYEDVLNGAAASADVPITEIENARYSLNHAQVGAYFAQSWHLSDQVWKAILLHHDYQAWTQAPRDLAVRIAALGLIAEEVVDRIHGKSSPEWEQGGEIALDVLELGADDIAAYMDAVKEALE